jgi:hypothetical protein
MIVDASVDVPGNCIFFLSMVVFWVVTPCGLGGRFSIFSHEAEGAILDSYRENAAAFAASHAVPAGSWEERIAFNFVSERSVYNHNGN